MGYMTHVIKGISWVGLFRFGTRGISFFRIAIIARILSPLQFGLFGIASLMLSMIEVITEIGINVILLQIKEKIDEYINTAWIISIIRGILIFFIIFISSFIMVQFFNAADAIYLIMLISLVPLIRGFINPAIIKFQKDLLFEKEFYYRTAIFFVESIVTITLVMLLQSPSALIWGLIAGAFFEVIISFYFIRPIPKIIFNYVIARHIISRGKWMNMTSIFSYFFQNGDNIAVGRIIGISALGIYEMAYKIAMLPITEISNVIVRVTFPVYLRIADDKARMRKAYFQSLLLAAVVSVPIGLIFIIFPQDIIKIILGQKWLVAAPVFQVLAIVGVIQAIMGDSGAIFLANKKQEYTTINTGISFLIMAIMIVPLTHAYGLIGAGLAVIVGAVATLPVTIYFLVKLLK